MWPWNYMDKIKEEIMAKRTRNDGENTGTNKSHSNNREQENKTFSSRNKI